MKKNNFEEKVKEVLSEVKKDDSGKLVLPDGVDEAIEFAVKTELRRKDTQAEYTRARQQLKTLQAEKEKISEQWQKDYINSNTQITEDMQLLKETDPDEYIRKSLENSNMQHKNFKETQESITKQAYQEAEKERRRVILDLYNTEFPHNPITDEVIERDLPPRLYQDLELGKIDFENFIAKASKILNGSKAIKKPQYEDTPNFNVASSSNTTNNDLVKEHEKDYKNMIF